METKGLSPFDAIPAAMLTACCSAMPTSKTLSGKSRLTSAKPVPSSIAALMPTTVSSSLMMREMVCANTLE